MASLYPSHSGSPTTRFASHTLGLIAAAALILASCKAAPNPDTLRPHWWKHATFYEIFVRSFADASHGPLARDGKGDLQGLIDHLDYLNDGNPSSGKSLGVTALWLMPVQPSPSYHGYDVTDYRAVNPDYGDIPLMKRLVAEAHRRGIRVIVDFVLNHASSQHPLFKQAVADPSSPARAMFRFARAPEQAAGPWGQTVWHPAGGSFYYGVFTAEMPDWNFRDPAVTEHHRRAARFWLDDIGVDGLRLDAVRYFYEDGNQLQDTPETRAWLRAFTDYCHRIKPGSFVVGECYADSPTIASYQNAGACDSLFEFDLAHATIQAVKDGDPKVLASALSKVRRLDHDSARWSIFLANHDQERTLTQLGGDRAKARLAAELEFSLPGVPFVYYGEEIGMQGAKPDPDLRTPMQWTSAAPNAGFTAPGVKPWHPVNSDATRVNVAREESSPSSLLSLYKRLIRMNASSPALRRGRPLPLSGGAPGVYAEFREIDGDAALVVANLRSKPVECPALSLASSGLCTGVHATEVLQGVPVTTPAVTPGGGFRDWSPLASLAAETAYVIRFSGPAAGSAP